MTTRVAPVSRLLTVTVAPMTPTPAESSTLPEIEAVTCAHPKAGSSTSTKPAIQRRRSTKSIIRTPSQCFRRVRGGNGQHAGTENPRSHPAGVQEAAWRRGKHNLVTGYVQGLLQHIPALRVHQSKVLQNSIYVPVERLAEQETLGAEMN